MSSGPVARRGATVSPPDATASTAFAPPWRVRGRAAFDALGRSHHRARRGLVWAVWAPPSATGATRVAYAVGRRAGNAVVRNRIRRRLRAAVGTTALPPGDLLVGAAGAAATMPFAELQAQVRQAVTAAGGAVR